ncbi:MAG: type II toxin-antitoxin system VapC family toxin [Chloroflexota bacterium]|nr:type II toxin-antitoxin system VapC family toxin [Chloroflexota bacterium]
MDWLRERPAARQFVRSLSGEGVAISLMTYGEIYTGIFRGPGAPAKENAFLEFLREVRVLPLDESIMRRFGQVQAILLDLGQGIGVSDVLIAATALHHDLTLVTRNLGHFRRVPDLKIYGET